MVDFKRFEGNPDFVLSLARGLSVIEAFQGCKDGITVGEAALRTGLSRAAARRLLLTLEMLGYASHNGSIYRLNSRVLRLGFSFLSSDTLADVALPVLEDVRTAIQESSSISTLEDGEVVYRARAASNRVLTVSIAIGARFPAYCTSMGRVLLAALPMRELQTYLDDAPFPALTPRTIATREGLLAELDRVRIQGYALVDEELELGLRSLAVPVMTPTGRVVAAINTGVHASRVQTAEMLDRFLPVLRDGARRLGLALG